jgi:hypothetical protein
MILNVLHATLKIIENYIFTIHFVLAYPAPLMMELKIHYACPVWTCVKHVQIISHAIIVKALKDTLTQILHNVFAPLKNFFQSQTILIAKIAL